VRAEESNNESVLGRERCLSSLGKEGRNKADQESDDRNDSVNDQHTTEESKTVSVVDRAGERLDNEPSKRPR
jgi:hypothetical protein